jgi:prepilin-type N-terminal cleavage/methylation domain-containing protein
MQHPVLSIRKGFTLIELLIVVAIIAILAAVAVPNFLEAQTRSKVSRAKSDMRSVATALEAYFVDHNTYPWTVHNFQDDRDGYGVEYRADDTLTLPVSITTPVAFLTSLPADVFKIGKKINGPNKGSSRGKPYQSGNPRDLTFLYLNMKQDEKWRLDGDPFFYSATAWESRVRDWGLWQMRSMGPTGLYPGATGYPGASFASVNAIYDPTNGTVSVGMVLRTQKSAEGNQKD